MFILFTNTSNFPHGRTDEVKASVVEKQPRAVISTFLVYFYEHLSWLVNSAELVEIVSSVFSGLLAHLIAFGYVTGSDVLGDVEGEAKQHSSDVKVRMIEFMFILRMF